MKRKELFPLLLILIVSIVSFYPSLFNDFQMLWDDDDYVVNNPYIKSISPLNIFKLFGVILSGNYHPLTLLSNAIEYYFFELNPFIYHLNNLIIHLLNICLVYYFFIFQSRSLSMAIFISFIFGIHPMHVESVAWISERKDLLYGFFFLSSILSYLYYLRKKKTVYSILSYISFILSVLSKSAGIILPLILILIEYMEGYKINIKSFIKKTPYFIISIAFGILAIYTQKVTGAIQSYPQFNLLERILFIIYGYSFYIIKFFIPENLSALHLYPIKTEDLLPLKYYFSPLILLFISTILFLIKKRRTAIIIGLLFYSICIGLVLQLIPLGPSLVSERFSYIPYIGISYSLYMIGLNLYEFAIKNNKKWIVIIIFLIGLIYSVTFIFKTFQRTKQWENSIILLEDAITKNERGEYSYWMKGNMEFYKKEFLKSKLYFDTLIHLKPDYPDAYHNRGYVKYYLKDYTGAISDYNLAIKHGVKGVNTYIDRGYSFYILKDYDNAMYDYNFVIGQDSSKAEAYFYRGELKTRMKDSSGAVSDFNKAIQLKSNYIEAIASRAMILFEMKKFHAAEMDFSHLLHLKPEMFELYNYRGVCRMHIGETSKSIEDFYIVIQKRPLFSEAYVNRGLLKLKLNNKSGACEDWKQAANLNNHEAAKLIEMYCKNTSY